MNALRFAVQTHTSASPVRLFCTREPSGAFAIMFKVAAMDAGGSQAYHDILLGSLNGFRCYLQHTRDQDLILIDIFVKFYCREVADPCLTYCALLLVAC